MNDINKINFLDPKLKLQQKKLIADIKDYDYRFTRYKVNYSMAICYSPEDIDLSIFKNKIRNSDRYLSIQNNLCAIIFDFTNDAQGIKAANNILTIFQSIFFSKILFMSVVTASNYRNSSELIYTLFDQLRYSINHNMDNLLVDSSQMIA